MSNKILQEAFKRYVKEPSSKPDFLKSLFQHQRNFILDPSKNKAALCSRRAGKSHTAAAYLLKTAIDMPGTSSVYIGLTRKSAKRIMWGVLKQLCRKHKIETSFNNTELTITLDNESIIYLIGASDSDDIETLRGWKYALVIVDECASFKSHFQPLVEEVIEPALIDLDGTLCLLGTPAAACVGLFYEATTGISSGEVDEEADDETETEKPWSVHRWTILDNPHIKNAEVWLRRKLKLKGWTEDHPVYQREWLGRWVKSIDSLVYKFLRGRNTYTELPDLKWQYLLGIDLGWDDQTAFVVLAFSEDDPKAYVVETYSSSQMDITATAEKVREFMGKYELQRLVVDSGGLGKSIMEEMKRRHELPLIAAEKTAKHSYIELLNADLHAGKLLIPVSEKRLIEEMELLQWDDNKRVRKEDDRFSNHLCDAMLYVWRESRHYTHEPPRKKPRVNTVEYFQEIEKETLNALEKRFVEQESQPWWVQ